MAKPTNSLELHYPMIQFLIRLISTVAQKGNTKIKVPVQQYLFQYTSMFFITTIYIPVQILFRYRIVSSSTEIYVLVQKHIYIRLKNNLLQVPVQKCMFQYRNIYTSYQMVYHIIRADILRSSNASNEQNVREYYMINHLIRDLLFRYKQVLF